MSERAHTKLEVWKKAVELVTEIYRLTNKYPQSERYGLMSQMKRAAVSVPSNIAEGVARKTTNEYIQFVYMVRGSASELDTQIEISKNLGYIEEEKYREIISELNRISRMLSGLIRALGEKE